MENLDDQNEPAGVENEPFTSLFDDVQIILEAKLLITLVVTFYSIIVAGLEGVGVRKGRSKLTWVGEKNGVPGEKIGSTLSILLLIDRFCATCCI